MANALGLLRDGGAEVDDTTPLGEATAVLRQQHCATPGGEHDAGHLSQRLDRLALAQPKACLAFLLEDVGDVDTRASLDLTVAVVEWQVQGAREMAADGRLARAHRPDEKYAGLAEHAGQRIRARRGGQAKSPSAKKVRPPRGGRRSSSER